MFGDMLVGTELAQKLSVRSPSSEASQLVSYLLPLLTLDVVGLPGPGSNLDVVGLLGLT